MENMTAVAPEEKKPIDIISTISFVVLIVTAFVAVATVLGMLIPKAHLYFIPWLTAFLVGRMLKKMPRTSDEDLKGDFPIAMIFIAIIKWLLGAAVVIAFVIFVMTGIPMINMVLPGLGTIVSIGMLLLGAREIYRWFIKPAKQ